MASQGTEKEAKVLARSPGRYPILVVELSSGELCTLYYETGYDLEKSKSVSEDWLWENAIGRHSFIAVNPPRKVSLSDLRDYVSREFLEEA
jgi:hypothetical protein